MGCECLKKHYYADYQFSNSEHGPGIAQMYLQSCRYLSTYCHVHIALQYMDDIQKISETFYDFL